MRADSKLPSEIRQSGDWQSDKVSGKQSQHVDTRRMGMGLRADGRFYTYSLSGSERNHLFINRDARQFTDISIISGLDAITDSRAFSLLDYDRDGWQDIALVNANSPQLNLFHNEMGSDLSSDAGFIALRFIGGNESSDPSSLSCRDGIGTVVRIVTDQKTIVREHHCGEGLAARNSSTMIVGIGDQTEVKSIDVRWPSGRTQQIGRVPASSLITIFENATSHDHQIEAYAKSLNLAPRIKASHRKTTGLTIRLTNSKHDDADLHLYTTMATWCPSCKTLLPQLNLIRSRFAPETLGMIGIPADPADTIDKLNQYELQYQPPYKVMKNLDKKDLKEVSRILYTTLPRVALPSTFVTDKTGAVLAGFVGVPTVSDLSEVISSRQLE